MKIHRDDILAWLKAYANLIAEKKEFLTDLDAAIGDADHGINMNRGFQAVMKKVDELSTQNIGAILKTVGMTLLSTVGGAGGPLYATFFLQAGMKTTGKMELTLAEWVTALDAAVNGVQMRGKAELGDKTMIDALVPAIQALQTAQENGASLQEALQQCAHAAEEGMKATIPLVARKGRASYLGERSAGHQDPGATSSYYLLQTAADIWGS